MSINVLMKQQSFELTNKWNLNWLVKNNLYIWSPLATLGNVCKRIAIHGMIIHGNHSSFEFSYWCFPTSHPAIWSFSPGFGGRSGGWVDGDRRESRRPSNKRQSSRSSFGWYLQKFIIVGKYWTVPVMKSFRFSSIRLRLLLKLLRAQLMILIVS